VKTTIGRIVHFVDGDMQEWPAIITFVHSDTLVDLTVFRSKGALLFECITSEELVGTHDSPSSHSWHWPVR